MRGTKRCAVWGTAVVAALAGMATAADGQRWSARWITAPGAAQRDFAVLHFRKAIELAEKPGRFVVDVSADNQFILYVNGKEAGRGPSRADLAHWRYETYDIGPLLHAGKNLLAATVWHFGTQAAVAQMSDRTGFLLHGASEAERAADTDATWEAEEETGISLLRPKVHGYFAAEPGERWDGARFDWSATTDRRESAKAEAVPQRLKPPSQHLLNVGAKAPTPMVRSGGGAGLGAGAIKAPPPLFHPGGEVASGAGSIKAPTPMVRSEGGAGRGAGAIKAATSIEGEAARTDDGLGRNWLKAVTLGRGALREEQDAPNNWQLVADRLPAMEMREVAAGKVVRSGCPALSGRFPGEGMTLPERSKCSVLVDHGELTTGYPAVTVREGHGATIRLTYAEALVNDKGEKGNRNEIAGKHIEGVVDEFLPGGGSSKGEFSPLSWRTWRYLQMDVETADAPVRIEGLKTWFSAYPFEEKAYFHADDATLEPIWKIGWRTARLDAHDTYMDTPYWERLQYIGDTRIQALISYTVAGDDRLGRQAIEAFNDSRVTDGLTQSRYPSSLVQMIPTFSLMWVGMVHDFWMYRGDGEFVRRQIPGMRGALGWFLRRQRPDGLLGKISWWPFVDWGADFRDGVPPQDAEGGSAAMTLQFVEALRDAAELERAQGDAHVAEQYEEAAAKATEGVRKLCWNEKYGLLADTPAQKHFSQHANILGVWLDVIPAERQKEVLTKILSTSDSGFAASGEVPAMTAATYYFRFYLARAVEHAELGDEYLKLLEPWRRMVGLGLTTWAESPEPTRSDSHAWSAHPNFDVLRIVAGIRPATAGFGRVMIEPHLGGLKEVKAAMPIPQGMVEVEYQDLGKAGVMAKVNLPEGVTGELVWKGTKTPLNSGENLRSLLK